MMLGETKKCARCDKVKTVDQFNKYGTKLQSYCRECQLEAVYERDRNNPHSAWSRKVRSAHKQHGKPIQASQKEVFELALKTPHCSLCGITLDYSQYTGDTEKGASDYSPSLDRVDSSKPTTIDNLSIVCTPCNMGKREGTVEEYIERCRRVVERHGDKL